MKTLATILEDWFTNEPYEVAKDHLYELLCDIDEAHGFCGGAWSADDIMDNLENR